jgi:hypothetical protein
MSDRDKSRQQPGAIEENGGQPGGPNPCAQLVEAVATEREMLHRLECEIRR